MENRRRQIAAVLFIIILIIVTVPIIGTVSNLASGSSSTDSTFDQKELSKAFGISKAETEGNLAKSRSTNLFPFDSFVKGISPDRTDMWSDFAKVDEDSAELVLGIDTAQQDSYIKIRDLIVENGGRLVNTVSIEDEVIAVVADFPLGLMPSFVEDVQSSNLARYVEPNMKYHSQLVPNDPNWGLQWGPQKIEADWAWNTTIGNSSILVAVIDTGVDYDHPDLDANYVPLGYDWVNDDTDPMDDHGHGTHCAGIIAAELNNEIGIAGIANVSIMAEKVLDSDNLGSSDLIALGIIHATDQGAKIISMSFAGYYPSGLVYDAVRYAFDSGVLLVAAAGNEATSVKFFYPAVYDEVIAVTATDANDDPAVFTNWGKWVEVAAPGVNIYSTVWNDTYAYMSGTSMSTPHVSGTAALILSQFANVTRDWVRAQLRYSADDLGDPGFDNYYGYGRINARKVVEQAPPDHDLLILDWDRQQYFKPGELATFNVTVLNFGISDETDIDVQLLVNGDPVDSKPINLLPGGVSTIVGLSWTPTVEGTYNVSSYVVPELGEISTQNNLITEFVAVVAPPPDIDWVLLATDPDEEVGTSLKAIHGQLYSGIIFFKVEHHLPWATFKDIDAGINTGILIDADQNSSTGLPDGFYPGQNSSIGADYVIVVGWEATEMWTWDPLAELWDVENPISLAYLDAPDGSNVFVVGVYYASIETAGVLDCAVCDTPSDWDWMPDAGYFTWFLITQEHDLAVFLETPQSLQPSETSQLNATVHNIGLNNEANVKIQLLIDGDEVASETLVELVNGTWHSINYSWAPATEGIYNITAYVPPVPSENSTANNIVTRFVYVYYVTHTLWVDSSPIFGVNFTLADVVYTTPWSDSLPEGSYTIEMPSTWTVESDEYTFAYWEDESTNPTRIIDLTANNTVIAYYVLAPKQWSLTVNSDPVNEISFTVDGVTHITPWSNFLDEGDHTIVMPSSFEIYNFDHWEDESTDSTRTLSLTADTVVTAYYVERQWSLTVNSDPISDVEFTIDGLAQTTPYSASLVEGSCTIVMPSSWTVDADVYNFAYWEDESTESTRTITLTEDTTITATYELYVPPLGWIEGYVTDIDTRAALVGAAVVADGVSTTTDAAGFYMIEIDPEDYTVTASASGYYDKSKIATVTAGEITTINFTIAAHGVVAEEITEPELVNATNPFIVNATEEAATSIIISEISDPITIVVKEVAEPVDVDPPPGTWEVLGSYVQITVNNTDITIGATIRIYYTLEQLETSGLDENTLQIRFWNATSGEWEAVESHVNTEEHYVWAIVDHLSLFSIMGEPREGVLLPTQLWFFAIATVVIVAITLVGTIFIRRR